MACDNESYSLDPSFTHVVTPHKPFSLWEPLTWFGMNRYQIAESLGVTIVCISDTHGHHRSLRMPPGDILIHAGDYTRFGKKEQAIDFNDWLGGLSYREKIVVQGNHETNAEWKNNAKIILSNATLLIHEPYDVKVEDVNNEFKGGGRIRFFGTEFFWPCKGHNPYFDQIDESVSIVISHCPAKGFVDNGLGCPSLASALTKVYPKVVISGHIHSAGHGVTKCHSGITYVNAALAGKNSALSRQPIILKL